MAGGTAAWSGRALGPLLALAGRLRAGGWRRWVAGVLAFNIALGMGFSVVALRHQADARVPGRRPAGRPRRRRLRPGCRSCGGPSAPPHRPTTGIPSPRRRHPLVDDRRPAGRRRGRRQQRTTPPSPPPSPAYQRAADQVVVGARPTAAPTPPASAAVDELVPAADALHAAVGRHGRAGTGRANTAAGLIADVETCS